MKKTILCQSIFAFILFGSILSSVGCNSDFLVEESENDSQQLVADLTVSWIANDRFNSHSEAITIFKDGLQKELEQSSELDENDPIRGMIPMTVVDHPTPGTLNIKSTITEEFRTFTLSQIEQSDTLRNEVPDFIHLKYAGFTENEIVSLRCRIYFAMNVDMDTYTVEEIQSAMRNSISALSGYLGYPESHETHYPEPNYLEIEP